MSEITDWEPLDLKPTPQERESQLIESNREYRSLIKQLEAKLSQLEALHAKALSQALESHTQTFTCFKADVLVLLKALELVAIASQRQGKIALNHHVRDMRLAHLQGIITNAIGDFSDRTLSTYDDDF